MNIYIYNKNFFKESKEVQKAIVSGVDCLYNRIKLYENQNIEFGKIFNDPKVKYDKHGNFYTLKFQKLNMQIRLLYSYLIIDSTPVIIVADYFIKKKNSKEYIAKFDYVNNFNPFEIYEQSEIVCSA